MNKYVKKDLSKSIERFNDIIKPKLQNLLKGSFLTVEGESSDIMKEILDTLAGIDSWHIDKLRGIRGIASRIQEIDTIKYPNSKPYNTFTIRNKRASGKSTEYEKRKYAIKNDYLYPFYTIQAYINLKDNSLMSCAIAKTKDIIEYIDKYKPIRRQTSIYQKGQANFWIIKWDDFKNKNFKIYIL